MLRAPRQHAHVHDALAVGCDAEPLRDPGRAAQLAALKTAGMPAVCEQNRVGLTDKNNDIIVGWMHGDEPDNAQELGDDKGYGPPIEPKAIVVRIAPRTNTLNRI